MVAINGDGMINCKSCGVDFHNLACLHRHIKVHKMSLPDYYCHYYPRRDLLSGERLAFKFFDDYFSSYFSSKRNMDLWLEKTNVDIKKPVILEMLQSKISKKSITIAPNEVELYCLNLPSIREYKKCFNSYSSVVELTNLSDGLFQKIPQEFYKDFSNTRICVDTREKKPLCFPSATAHKLDIGDYGVIGDDFNYTFADRKSFQDFCGTMVGDNYERFRREIIRCKEQNCYLWVVIEAKLSDAEITNNRLAHKANLGYVFHQMRVLRHEFKDSLQFVFSGGREQSQDLIPRLLCLGKKLWNVDMQYWLENN